MHKILAIDDKRDNLIAVSALIRTLIPNCDVINAMSGTEGIHRAKTEMPDVILLDIIMPGMDGWEVCQKLKSDPETQHIPIILMTAIKTDPESRVKGLEIGAEAFLSKPIDELELVAQIKVMLRIKQAEDVLRNRKNKLEQEVSQRARLNQLLLDALPCVAFLINPKSRKIITSNKAAMEAGALPGKLCYHTWGKRSAPCPWCLAEKTCETKTPQKVEIDQNVAIYDAHWYPLNEDMFLHYIFDITEQKRIIKELQQAQKMEAVGTLAGGIAHDFNNILGIIIGNIELAMEDLPEDSMEYDSLKEAQIASFRGRELIKQILKFSRSAKTESEPIWIAPVITEAVSLLRASIPTTVTIKTDIADIPDIVIANPTQINQIILNLCTNAVDAMNYEGILDISLCKVYLDSNNPEIPQKMTPGHYIKLSVKDTGNGIEPKIINRIFDPYFTTKPIGKGTGMGLSIIYGIIKEYKGAITVDSTPNSGTRFDVFLPVVEKKVRESTPSLPSVPKGSERLLFVDDEDLLVRIVAKMLESLGYDVVCTHNSTEALAIFRSAPESFDMVISDVTMPGIPGHKLAEHLLMVRKDIPIILCTGHSELIDDAKAKAIGVKKLIHKPVNKALLGFAIREVLEQHKEN